MLQQRQDGLWAYLGPPGVLRSGQWQRLVPSVLFAILEMSCMEPPSLLSLPLQDELAIPEPGWKAPCRSLLPGLRAQHPGAVRGKSGPGSPAAETLMLGSARAASVLSAGSERTE